MSLHSLTHFIELSVIPAVHLRQIVANAHKRKAARKGLPKGLPDQDNPLHGYILACLFQKSSTRTRFSFEVGMQQLGGSSIIGGMHDLQLKRGETLLDTAQVLQRYADALMIRANNHSEIIELTQNVKIPVINGLTDYNHPCQILADIMTMQEAYNTNHCQNLHIAWLGEGNNVTMSLINACTSFGYKLALACPQGYGLPSLPIKQAQEKGAQISIHTSPQEACKNADIVMTDTWFSMGVEKKAQEQTAQTNKHAHFAPYQVDVKMMAHAKPKAFFMHCLPAHRGDEVSAEVIDSPQSIVFEQAENRLHIQKEILLYCLQENYVKMHDE